MRGPGASAAEQLGAFILPHLDRIDRTGGLALNRGVFWMMRSALALGVLATGLAFRARRRSPIRRRPISPIPMARRLLSAATGRSRRPRFRTTTMTTFRRTSAPRRATIRRRPAAIAARSPRPEPRPAPAAGLWRPRPAVVYGDRNDGYAPPPPYGGRRPIGSGQPESYGAAPQAAAALSAAAAYQQPIRRRPIRAAVRRGAESGRPVTGPMQLAPEARVRSAT